MRRHGRARRQRGRAGREPRERHGEREAGAESPGLAEQRRQPHRLHHAAEGRHKAQAALRHLRAASPLAPERTSQLRISPTPPLLFCNQCGPCMA